MDGAKNCRITLGIAGSNIPLLKSGLTAKELDEIIAIIEDGKGWIRSTSSSARPGIRSDRGIRASQVFSYTAERPE